MTQVALWVQPDKYNHEMVKKGNKEMLKLLKYLQQRGLINLNAEVEERLANTEKIYKHTIYVEHKEMKLMCSYDKSLLRINDSYKDILPSEDRFERCANGEININLVDGK